jgi:hypothetical protein
MGNSVGRLRTSEGVGTRIFIIVCVLTLDRLSHGEPEMGIFRLTILT